MYGPAQRAIGGEEEEEEEEGEEKRRRGEETRTTADLLWTEGSSSHSSRVLSSVQLISSHTLSLVTIVSPQNLFNFKVILLNPVIFSHGRREATCTHLGFSVTITLLMCIVWLRSNNTYQFMPSLMTCLMSCFFLKWSNSVISYGGEKRLALISVSLVVSDHHLTDVHRTAEK